MKSFSLGRLRGSLASLAGACVLLVGVASPAAAATPATATDWFTGVAVVPTGQASPVVVNPRDVTRRSDGAVGLGYTYSATGRAMGTAPGSFTYQEKGYLYFTNPSNPSTMVGSRFTSGVFTLAPGAGKPNVRIADTAPEHYTSGIQTVATKINPRVTGNLNGLIGPGGELTYGYFTFTNQHGTSTGYATPDFTRFIIQISFDPSSR
jgi:hypothetical protein